MKKKIEIHTFRQIGDDWKHYSSVTVDNCGGSVTLNFEGENDNYEVVIDPEGFEIFKKQFTDLKNDEAACCMEDICMSVPEVDVNQYTCCWLTFDPQLLAYRFIQVNMHGDIETFGVFNSSVQKFFETIEEAFRY